MKSALASFFLSNLLVVNANHVTLTSLSCNNDLPLTVTSLSADCTDGCGFGDEVPIYGTVVLYGYPEAANDDAGEYYTNVSVNLTAPMGVWHPKILLEAVDVCDAIVSDDDADANDCPEDGTYQLSTSFLVPSPPTNYGSYVSPWVLSGWSIVADVSIVDSLSIQLLNCSSTVRFMSGSEDDEVNSNYRFMHPSASDSTLLTLGIAACIIVTMILAKIVQNGRTDSDEQATRYNNMAEPIDEIMMQRSNNSTIGRNNMV